MRNRVWCWGGLNECSDGVQGGWNCIGVCRDSLRDGLAVAADRVCGWVRVHFSTVSHFPIRHDRVTWPRRVLAVFLLVMLGPVFVLALSIDTILKAVGYYDKNKAWRGCLAVVVGLGLVLSGCGSNGKEYLKKDRTELEGTLMVSQR